MPSGLVTILFTDMESSTALRRKLGDAKVQELVRAHNEIVRDALKASGGNEVKHTGDGIMASFTTATSALQCAIAIQQGVASRAEEQPDMPLAVYIGLNAGEPIAEEQDLFGTSVDLAQFASATTRNRARFWPPTSCGNWPKARASSSATSATWCRRASRSLYGCTRLGGGRTTDGAA